jgi:hypothetical protein
MLANKRSRLSEPVKNDGTMGLEEQTFTDFDFTETINEALEKETPSIYLTTEQATLAEKIVINNEYISESVEPYYQLFDETDDTVSLDYNEFTEAMTKYYLENNPDPNESPIRGESYKLIINSDWLTLGGIRNDKKHFSTITIPWTNFKNKIQLYTQNPPKNSSESEDNLETAWSYLKAAENEKTSLPEPEKVTSKAVEDAEVSSEVTIDFYEFLRRIEEFCAYYSIVQDDINTKAFWLRLLPTGMNDLSEHVITKDAFLLYLPIITANSLTQEQKMIAWNIISAKTTKPLRTITLFACMHGSLTSTTVPVHVQQSSLLLTSSAKCGLSTFNNKFFFRAHSLIRKIRSVYKGFPEESQVTNGNIKMAELFDKKRRLGFVQLDNGEYLDSSSTNSTIFRDWLERKTNREDEFHLSIDELIHAAENPNPLINPKHHHHIRSHTLMEKIWGPDDSNNAIHQANHGLYIISTHHCEDIPYLQSLDNWSYPNLFKSYFNNNISDTLSKSLIFSDVFDGIRSHIKTSSGKFVPPLHPRTTPVDINVYFKNIKINRYNQISIINLVDAFLSMGFEMVNIVDTSCQDTDGSIISGSPTDTTKLVRQASIGSTRKGYENMELLSRTHTGGKQKTKRQNNRGKTKRNKKNKRIY